MGRIMDWLMVKTSKNHLLLCQNETNVLMTFPLNTGKVLVFVSWLLFTRKVKAKSAEVYISGLRCLHLINGHDDPALRPGIVNLIEAKSKRVAVTITLLKLLKKNLVKCDLDKERKFLLVPMGVLAPGSAHARPSAQAISGDSKHF